VDPNVRGQASEVDRNLGYFSRGQSSFSKLTQSIPSDLIVNGAVFASMLKIQLFQNVCLKVWGKGGGKIIFCPSYFSRWNICPTFTPLPVVPTPLNTTLAHTVIHI